MQKAVEHSNAANRLSVSETVTWPEVRSHDCRGCTLYTIYYNGKSLEEIAVINKIHINQNKPQQCSGTWS